LIDYVDIWNIYIYMLNEYHWDYEYIWLSMEFVSWDDDSFPTWKVIKSMVPVTTNQALIDV